MIKKFLIVWYFIFLMGLVGCEPNKDDFFDDSKYIVNNRTFYLDTIIYKDCEYVVVTNDSGYKKVFHKPNCRFCKQHQFKVEVK